MLRRVLKKIRVDERDRIVKRRRGAELNLGRVMILESRGRNQWKETKTYRYTKFVKRRRKTKRREKKDSGFMKMTILTCS